MRVSIMPRPGRPFAGLCIGVIAIAALLPGICSFGYAVIDPQWILLPDETLVTTCAPVASGDEQPRPLLSVLQSRAPPPSTLA